MVKPPYDPPEYPRDYLDYIAALHGQHRVVGRTELYPEPKDPCMEMGKQGSENFMSSVVLGRRTDQLQVVLKYDCDNCYAPRYWQYCLCQGAEWTVVQKFATFTDLLRYLASEPPLPPTPTVRLRPRRR